MGIEMGNEMMGLKQREWEAWIVESERFESRKNRGVRVQLGNSSSVNSSTMSRKCLSRFLDSNDRKTQPEWV